MYTAIIIDDEPKVRDSLTSMISTYCPTIKLIGQANTIETGYHIINNLKPDVVFLDIKMPDGTGFDLLKRFSQIDFYFFIITAYEEFAIKAFKFSALDYLLKPIDPDDLIKAVEKLTTKINVEETNRRVELLMANVDGKENEPNRIVLKTIDNVYIVEIKDIIRCESINNCTKFFTINQEEIQVSKTLKDYEELLAPLGFIRCHQSHLVNKNFIQSYSRFPNPELKLKNGTKIPVSMRKRVLFSNHKIF